MNKVLTTLALLVVSVAQAQTDSLMPREIPAVRVYTPRLTDVDFMEQGTDVMKIQLYGLPIFPTTELSTTLDYLPGVQSEDRGIGAQSDLSIQGSSFEQNMLLINGVKQIDVQTGHNMMNTPIPLCAISEIIVTKGAVSPRYGVGGLAGSVNLRVRPSLYDTTYIVGSASSNFEKDDSTGSSYYAAELMGNVSFGGTKARHMISLGFLNSNGYRYNTGIERYQMSYAMEYTPSENTSLELLTALGSSVYGASAFYAPPFDSDAQEKTMKFLIQSNLHTRLKNWNSSTVVYYKSDSDRYTLVEQDPSIYQNKHIGNTFGIEQNFYRDNRWGQLGLGMEFREETINSSNLGQHSRSYLGFFAEQKIALGESTLLTPSAYLGYNVLNGTQIFPGLDFNYSFSDHKAIYASVRRGLRNPSFTDLYYSDRANLGNPDLVAESGYTVNLGYRQYGDYHYFNLAPYFRNVSNYITWVDTQPDSTNAFWQPRNFSVVGTYGFSAIYKLSKISLGAKWQLGWSLGYNYASTDNELKDSKTAIQILRHQVISGLKFSNKKETFSSNLTYRYNEQLEGYSYNLVDFRAMFAVTKHFSVLLDINNIANTEYTSLMIPQPGRFFKFGFIKN